MFDITRIAGHGMKAIRGKVRATNLLSEDNLLYVHYLRKIMKRKREEFTFSVSNKIGRNDKDYAAILKDKMQNGPEQELIEIIENIPGDQLIGIKDEEHNCNIISWAAYRNLTDLLSKALDKTPVLLKDRYLTDAFFRAVRGESLEVMNTLLTLNGDLIYSTDKKGNNGFLLAIRFKQLQVMEFLLKYDRKLIYSVDKDGDNAFLLATIEGDLEMMEFLLKYDSKLLYSVNEISYNAFLMAACMGNLQVIDFLLKKDHNFFIKTKTSMDNTALNIAADKGHVEVVRRLLQLDDSLIGMADIYGSNAFLIAAWHGYLDITKELLKYHPGCINDTRKNSHNAFSVQNPNKEMALLLLSYNIEEIKCPECILDKWLPIMGLKKQEEFKLLRRQLGVLAMCHIVMAEKDTWLGSLPPEIQLYIVNCLTEGWPTIVSEFTDPKNSEYLERLIQSHTLSMQEKQQPGTDLEDAVLPLIKETKEDTRHDRGALSKKVTRNDRIMPDGVSTFAERYHQGNKVCNLSR